MDADFTTIWGAAIGFNFSQDGTSTKVYSWDAAAAGVQGFQFTVSAVPESGLRLTYRSDGVDYCKEITRTGLQTVLFSDTRSECWDVTGSAPATTSFESMHWQVTASEDAEYDFAFCISDLAAIP